MISVEHYWVPTAEILDNRKFVMAKKIFIEELMIRYSALVPYSYSPSNCRDCSSLKIPTVWSPG